MGTHPKQNVHEKEKWGHKFCYNVWINLQLLEYFVRFPKLRILIAKKCSQMKLQHYDDWLVLCKRLVNWNKVFKENIFCTPHFIYLSSGFCQRGLEWNSCVFNLSTFKDTLPFSVKNSQASTELSKMLFFPVSIVKSLGRL